MSARATKKPAAAAKRAAKKPANRKAPSKNKGGRPSKYSRALIEAICARLKKGEPLAAICRDKGMPDPSTVWDWQQSKPEVSQAIAHAREAGEDWLASECLEIADDGRNDWMEKLDKDGQPVGWMLNGEHVSRSKLRIETRLKLLAKWNPKKYGDRLTHAGDAESPVTVVVRRSGHD